MMQAQTKYLKSGTTVVVTKTGSPVEGRQGSIIRNFGDMIIEVYFAPNKADFQSSTCRAGRKLFFKREDLRVL